METKHTEGVLFHCGRLQTGLEFNAKRKGKNGNFFTLRTTQWLSTAAFFLHGDESPFNLRDSHDFVFFFSSDFFLG